MHATGHQQVLVKVVAAGRTAFFKPILQARAEVADPPQFGLGVGVLEGLQVGHEVRHPAQVGRTGQRVEAEAARVTVDFSQGSFHLCIHKSERTRSAMRLTRGARGPGASGR